MTYNVFPDMSVKGNGYANVNLLIKLSSFGCYLVKLLSLFKGSQMLCKVKYVTHISKLLLTPEITYKHIRKGTRYSGHSLYMLLS